MADEPNNGTRRQVDVIIARLELQTAQTLQAVTELKLWLMGDGTAGNPGVIIRLDRLEQIEINRETEVKATKTWRIGLLTSIGLLFIERFWHWISVFVSKH